MSKRRFNKQQQRRIEQQQSQIIDNNHHHEGVVLCRYQKEAEVMSEDKKIYLCAIKPGIGSAVSGDRIIFDKENEQQGKILAIKPRTNVLERPDFRQNPKPIAANISLMNIVLAPKPEPSWLLIDSYLVMATHLDVTPIIILNKSDLNHQLILEYIKAVYEPLGIEYQLIQKADLKSYDILKQRLNNETSIFVGQSGVGKSSIISQLIPHETSIRTQSLSEHFEQGQHTTSTARYYLLPDGGAVIDAPGVRSMTLSHIETKDILKAFPDVTSWISRCKFRNCAHGDTKGCAVMDALQKGLIHQERFLNFNALSKL